MKTNIYLTRHAHSIYTPDELNRPLSERGLKDAEKITELLSHEYITHAISSPYKRAIQTIEGTAAYFKLKIEIDNGFRERKLSDGPIENFKEAVLYAWKNLNFAPPGGEAGYCAQERGVKSLKNAIVKYHGSNIVIGTHGNLMVLIMNYYDKKYDYTFWSNLNMPDIYKLSFIDEILFEIRPVWRT